MCFQTMGSHCRVQDYFALFLQYCSKTALFDRKRYYSGVSSRRGICPLFMPHPLAWPMARFQQIFTRIGKYQIGLIKKVTLKVLNASCSFTDILKKDYTTPLSNL